VRIRIPLDPDSIRSAVGRAVHAVGWLVLLVLTASALFGVVKLVELNRTVVQLTAALRDLEPRPAVVPATTPETPTKGVATWTTEKPADTTPASRPRLQP
jgi:hypothetical protein